jgi:hypothetical protein
MANLNNYFTPEQLAEMENTPTVETAPLAPPTPIYGTERYPDLGEIEIPEQEPIEIEEPTPIEVMPNIYKNTKPMSMSKAYKADAERYARNARARYEDMLAAHRAELMKERTDNVKMAKFAALGNALRSMVQPLGWAVGGGKTTAAYQPYDEREYIQAFNRALQADRELRNVNLKDADYQFKTAQQQELNARRLAEIEARNEAMVEAARIRAARGIGLNGPKDYKSSYYDYLGRATSKKIKPMSYQEYLALTEAGINPEAVQANIPESVNTTDTGKKTGGSGGGKDALKVGGEAKMKIDGKMQTLPEGKNTLSDGRTVTVRNGRITYISEGPAATAVTETPTTKAKGKAEIREEEWWNKWGEPADTDHDGRISKKEAKAAEKAEKEAQRQAAIQQSAQRQATTQSSSSAVTAPTETVAVKGSKRTKDAVVDTTEAAKSAEAVMAEKYGGTAKNKKKNK